MMEAGRSRGFGFVSFFTLEDATTAASVMNGRMVAGRALRVTLSHHNEQKTQPEKQDSSSESLPAGQFTSAVPQVQKRLDVHPENLLALQPISRQAAACILAQSESLRPLMPGCRPVGCCSYSASVPAGSSGHSVLLGQCSCFQCCQIGWTISSPKAQ
ncbi:polyadenylate-binding protein 1A-like [Triplophysa rosa]|uniref:polyadenylate-binding protein 1A-like n=1 Tax=Triplophysa rosa TaxID=992332 RepID=UPI00254603F6|nr:polyadenylate-binding protein 1A-like [Triplophysa rosa]